MARCQQLVAAVCIAVACVAQFAAFVQLGRAPEAPENHVRLGATPSLPTARRGGRAKVTIKAAETGPGRGLVWAAILGAAAAMRGLSQQGNTFAGKTCQLVATSNMLVAKPGDADDAESPIIMGQVPRRTYVRISKRTQKMWKRGRRRNSAAAKRFLIKRLPSGAITVWRRQGGLRHLKGTKTKHQLRRLKEMVRMDRRYYKRLMVLLGIHFKPPQACDYIMRKFAHCRRNDRKGLSDHGVGTAMWAV